MPTLADLSFPTYSYIEPKHSYTYKLGSFAGRTFSYLRSPQGRRRALQTYVLTEASISLISIVSMILAKIYLPAILLALMLSYLIYASLGVF